MSPLWFIGFDIIAGLLGSLHFALNKSLYHRIQNRFSTLLTKPPLSRIALIFAGAIVSAIVLGLILKGMYIDL